MLLLCIICYIHRFREAHATATVIYGRLAKKIG